MSILQRWVLGAALVIGCGCQRLGDQPAPDLLPVPGQLTTVQSLSDDGVGYIELPGPELLAGGDIVVRLTHPNHGTLEADMPANRLVYTSDDTFDGVDTARYYLIRGGAESLREVVFTGRSRVCHPIANDDVASLSASEHFRFINILANDSLCGIATVSLLDSSAVSPFQLDPSRSKVLFFATGIRGTILTRYVLKAANGQRDTATIKVTVAAPPNACLFDPKSDTVTYAGATTQNAYINLNDLTRNDGCADSLDLSSFRIVTGGSRNMQATHDGNGVQCTFTYPLRRDEEHYFFYRIQSASGRQARTVRVTARFR